MHSPVVPRRASSLPIPTLTPLCSRAWELPPTRVTGPTSMHTVLRPGALPLPAPAPGFCAVSLVLGCGILPPWWLCPYLGGLQRCYTALLCICFPMDDTLVTQGMLDTQCTKPNYRALPRAGLPALFCNRITLRHAACFATRACVLTQFCGVLCAQLMPQYGLMANASYPLGTCTFQVMPAVAGDEPKVV